MPVKKITFRPGVNRENTRYTTEGGWYESDKVRFRQGTPEKIGGWARISANTFLGLCRSLWVWAVLSGQVLIGVLTSLRSYISYNGSYAEIVPYNDLWLGVTSFTATPGSSIITVNGSFYNQEPGTPWVGASVVFRDAISMGGNITAAVLNNRRFTILTVTNITGTFTIDVGTVANASDTGPGTTGSTGATYSEPAWSPYASQANFGADLVYAYRGGKMAYWNYKYAFLVPSNVVTISIASPAVVTTANNWFGTLPTVNDPLPVRFMTTGALPTGLTAGTTYYLLLQSGSLNQFQIYTTSPASGSPVTTSGSQSGVQTIDISADFVRDAGTAANSPEAVNYVAVSDIYRVAFAFGVNEYGLTGGSVPGPTPGLISPMLIRWSDQENLFDWTPSATNQAGSLLLSRGSEIITALQARQEMLVWTDAALYSLQYLGAEPWWGAQLLGDNISIVSQNCVAYANGIAYWMGKDKFYLYSGTTQTLKCDLRQYIFSDININQYEQVFAGTNEGFNEIWWWYCSANSSTIDKYVVFNYLENIWYYGSMDRTAWADSGLRDYPLAATYANNLVDHEKGYDNDITGTPAAITASITSAEFDVDDGDKFVFIRRVLPDLTFRNSTAGSPSGVLTFYPLKNSGAGYESPASEGGDSFASITRTATVPVEQFTGQVYVRIRARQLAMKFETTGLGVSWQLGSMRIDMKTDGTASGSGVSGG